MFVQFHEKTFHSFSYPQWTRLKFTKGDNFVKKSRVMVLVLIISSDNTLYLYQVLMKIYPTKKKRIQ